MRTYRIVMVAALALGLAGAVIAAREGKAKLRRAKRVLADIRLVDGAGSGLDADTVQGLKPLMVVDANGKFVGAVIDVPRGFGTAEIVRRLGGPSVRMAADVTGFTRTSLENDSQMVYFESGDCSGPVLMHTRQGSDLFFPPTAVVAGTNAYFVPDGTIGTMRSTNSVAVFGMSQTDCDFSFFGGSVFVAPMWCCKGGAAPQPLIVGPAVSFDLTTLGLAPPFHLDIPTDVSTPATRGAG